MPKEIILPAGTPAPLAPYVPATKADHIVYVSGILPLDAHNNVVHVGDAAAQTRHVLETIQGIVSHAGGTLKDITFNHIFYVTGLTMRRLTPYMPNSFQMSVQHATAYRWVWLSPKP